MDMECNLSKIRTVVFLGRSKFIKIFPIPRRPHSVGCKYMILLIKLIVNAKPVIKEQKEGLPSPISLQQKPQVT